MANHKSIGLGAITAGHTTEIECFLAGIQAGETWTTSLRPVVRKDDPPEDEDAS